MAAKLRERRPGQWWLYVDHKGQRFAKFLGRDKRSAAKVRQEVERRLAAGDLGILAKQEPTPPTFAAFAAGYLRDAELTLKHSTWKDYAANVRAHISPALGALPVAQITRRHVKDLAYALRHRGLKPKTVRKIVGTLSVILGEALDDGAIAANPAAALRKIYQADEFKGASRGCNPLTRDELAHLLHIAETYAIDRAGSRVHPYRRHRLFLLLLARTGLRLGEALALQWGDIDLPGGVLDVRRAIVRGRISTPKNKKPRRVDLSTQLRATLAEVRDCRFARVVALDPRLEAERRAAADVATAWVFPGATGEPMDGDNFRARVFGPLLAAAKLRRVRLHDLRHSFASQLIAAGKELHYVQQQMGHHSPAFTLAVYGHLLPRDRRGDVDCLDDATTCAPLVPLPRPNSRGPILRICS